MKTEEIVGAITFGTVDANLYEIREAVHNRLQALTFLKMTGIKVGDIIKFNEHCRPKMLIGCKGKVIDRKRTKVVVRLDNPPSNRWSGHITTSTNLLSIVQCAPETVENNGYTCPELDSKIELPGKDKRLLGIACSLVCERFNSVSWAPE